MCPRPGRPSPLSPFFSPLEQRLAHWVIADALQATRDFDEAIKEAETATALAPNDAWMLADLAWIYVCAGKPMKAVEWYDFAAARDPANAAFYSGLKGNALEIAGKPEESLAALNAGMLFAGFDHFVKAIDLSRLGRADEAKTEVKKGLKVNSSMTQAMWRNINIYRDPSIAEREIADLAKAGLPEK